MWGTLYGLLAVDRDGQTIRGLTFYDQKETPGLGGEISNPKWQALWVGRQAYDANWEPQAHGDQGQRGTARAGPAPRRRDLGRDDHQQRRVAADRVLAVRRRLRPVPQAVPRGGSGMNVLDTVWSPQARKTLLTPIIANNPIAVQVLGICSALAVTTRMDKAIVMGIGVTLVTALANLAVSLVRNYMPNSIRIIVQLAIIASLVIVVDQVLQGLPVRAVARAVGVRRPHHHQLHRDGPRRGLRDAEPAVAVVPRRHRQRPGLRAGADPGRVRARADGRRQDARLHGAAAGARTAAGTSPTGSCCWRRPRCSSSRC